jgi:hypothetical protein
MEEETESERRRKKEEEKQEELLLLRANIMNIISFRGRDIAKTDK